MIDESTNILITRHMVVFTTFVEKGQIASVFLGLLQIVDGKKDATLIFETLLTNLQEWGLDVNKCGIWIKSLLERSVQSNRKSTIFSQFLLFWTPLDMP